MIVLVSVLQNWRCLCGAPSPGWTHGDGLTSELDPGCDDTVVDHLRLIRVTTAGGVDPAMGASNDNGWPAVDLAPTVTTIPDVEAMGVTPDGKILIAGRCQQEPQTPWRALVARFDADGMLDSSFHGTGVWLPDFGVGGGFADLVVQPDGKIVLGGGVGPSLLLVRLLADGELDSRFGVGGQVVVNLGDPAGGWAWYRALAPTGDASDRDILVCQHNELARFRADGTADPTFGQAGVVRRPDMLWAGGLAVDDEGFSYVVGTTPGGGPPMYWQVSVEAFDPTGAVDRAFSPLLGRGRIETQLQPGRPCFTPGGHCYWRGQWRSEAWRRHFYRRRLGNGVLVRPQRVIVAGTTYAQKADPALDFALDFGLCAFRR